MNNPKVFDLLIVYTDGIAKSAFDNNNPTNHPFDTKSSRANYNDAYSYFLEKCSELNLSAAFTTTADLKKDSTFKGYWTFENIAWKKVQKPCYAKFIFDKFSPINKKQINNRKKLNGDPNIELFNTNELFELFFDKQKTFDKLSEFAIPTVSINNRQLENVTKFHENLKLIIKVHPFKKDFAKKIILKDRFGAGGQNIFDTKTNKITTELYEIIKNNNKVSFIIQPFTDFKHGTKEYFSNNYTDIRLIYSNSKLVQSYIRIAVTQNFKCNEHQGGKLEYIRIKDIPTKVKSMSQKIISQLEHKSSLFALDFIISSNGNVFLMEGNSSPGLDWNLKVRKNELASKKLIGIIVKEIKSRISITENPNLQKILIPKVIQNQFFLN